MTDHYTKAEDALSDAREYADRRDDDAEQTCLVEAQVHATLALTDAIRDLTDQWQEKAS